MWTDDGTLSMNEIKLIAYRVALKIYLRYVLFRCTKYTNYRKQVAEISVHTFITVCRLTDKLEHVSQLGSFLDCMIDDIGQDVIRNSQQSGEAWGYFNNEMLLADRKAQRLARGMNMLDGYTRQILFLHHVEMMSTKEIGQIFGKSIADIRRGIIAGERKLAKHLTKIVSNGNHSG